MCKNEAICTVLITFKGAPVTLSAKNIAISVVYSWVSMPLHMEYTFISSFIPQRGNWPEHK